MWTVIVLDGRKLSHKVRPMLIYLQQYAITQGVHARRNNQQISVAQTKMAQMMSLEVSAHVGAVLPTCPEEKKGCHNSSGINESSVPMAFHSLNQYRRKPSPNNCIDTRKILVQSIHKGRVQVIFVRWSSCSSSSSFK